MKFLYTIGVWAYYIVIHLASLFSSKAKLWVDGRKNWRENLKNKLAGDEGSIWIHCASLGEFEQGRPVLEALKKKYPGQKILLTFFSPSGYEIRKNYALADYVFYLPIDSKNNAKDFIRIARPSMVFFVKYEFWFYFLSEIKKNQIPMFLISANFRKGQHFFKWYGGWWKNMLKFYAHIFVQDQSSADLLQTIGLKNYSIAGDTRFDRVCEIAENKQSNALAEKFKNNQQVLIAGSTWPEDEQLLIEHINSDTSDWKYIIAPHEIGGHNIKSILSRLPKVKACRFSMAKAENIQEFKVLIIDNVGMLSSLYQYGNIAYIGGGFGAGIHNTLEAAVFGMPVVFGPEYHKFKEAKDLINLKGAFPVSDFNEFDTTVKKLTSDKELLEISSQISAQYVREHRGATKLILDYIGKEKSTIN